MRALSFLLLFWGMSNWLVAQEQFSGRLTYSIEYLEVQDDMKGVEAMLPSSIHIVTDGESWRSEQSTKINGDYSQLYDQEKDSIFETITIGPERVKVSYRSVGKIDLEPQKKLGPKVLERNTEIRQIASSTKNGQSIIQLTDFKSIPKLFFEGLTGVPTLIEMDNAGIKMRLKLESIVSEPIDETYFILPDDYILVDTELYQSWLR